MVELKCILLARQGPADDAGIIQDHLLELEELARSCNMLPVGNHRLRRTLIDPRTYYGSGQLRAVLDDARNLGASHLICDDELSGGQVRNIEKITGLVAMDRTGLILTIFEQRAQTREARAQVELARYEYELPRLKGAWTHLERQVGGVGIRGGPGEKQIEVDRRMTRLRIKQLKQELEHLERIHQTQRGGRLPDLPRVSLVGYTNAGKTTLLRALTGEGEPKNMLFATLDTTTRKAWLGNDESTGMPKHALISDTVGFIRKLPHQLVAAFRSTLGEVRAANALLVVTDAAHPELDEHLKVVGATLKEIGCRDHPRLLVLNQADRLTRPKRLDLQRRYPNAAIISALDKTSVDEVRSWLTELIPGPPKPRELEWWEL
ncbi:MAG: GTPase HflX [Holophagaceae bacterium]|nr:GTPase HflX [Holophagaceae bacterium]